MKHYSSQDIKDAFDHLTQCKPNWDSYGADPPNLWSIDESFNLVKYFEEQEILPGRIKPSVVGGVGVTYYTNNKKVYVEISNSKTIYVLFSDGISDPEVLRIFNREQLYNYLIYYFKGNIQ